MRNSRLKLGNRKSKQMLKPIENLFAKIILFLKILVTFIINNRRFCPFLGKKNPDFARFRNLLYKFCPFLGFIFL